MCGLSGAMSSSLSDGERDIFRDLFNISSLRGVEGCGVIVAQKEPNKAINVERIRSPHVSGVLAYSSELLAATKPPINLLVGHARWPTKGGKDREALHPHRSNHICGVHNGTLHRVAGELVKDGESDSAKLYESIAKIGVKETIKNTDGAYALVWVDEQDQTINFLRNSQRTLHFTNIGWQNNISTVFWSSEREMLQLIMGRSYKGTNTWDTYLPVDKHFKYPLKVEHRIVPVEVTELKPAPKVYPVTTMGFRGRGYYDDLNWEDAKTWRDYDDDIHGACPFEADKKPVGQDAVERIIGAAKPVIRPGEILALRSIEPALKKLQAEIDEARENWSQKKSKNSSKKYMRLIQKRSAMIDTAIKKVTKDEPKREVLRLPAPTFRDADQTPHTVDQSPNTVFKPNGDLNDNVEDLFQGRGNHYAGSCCSWCGSPVDVGEKVYPLDYSDLGGDKEFVCYDCGTNNADCKTFLHESIAVVACH